MAIEDGSVLVAAEVGRLAAAVERLVERDLREQRGLLEREIATRRPMSNGIGFLLRVPALAARFERRVPDEAIAEDGDTAVVDCRCGQRISVPVGGLVKCDCDRWFLNTGSDVRVTRVEPTK